MGKIRALKNEIQGIKYTLDKKLNNLQSKNNSNTYKLKESIQILNMQIRNKMRLN